MAKVSWMIRVNAIDITSKVLSASTTFGREKYLDTYSGGSLVFTINNASNYASGITYGATVDLISGTPNNEFYGTYWVQEVTFQDYPGNTGLNTATITAVDFMSRAGRVQANSLSLAQNRTGLQADLFEAGAGGPLPSDMYVEAIGYGDSIASATTYTGTVNNYFNLLNTTERGLIVERAGKASFISRSQVSSFLTYPTSLARTTSTTTIAYQRFTRIQNGTQFINTATISSTGIADQTAVNTASKASYGPAFYSSQTVDYSTTQANGNANWVANNFSDPASLRFEVSFNDLSQNATALATWMSDQWRTTNRMVLLTYQVPGGGSTSLYVIIEGATIDITPEETVFTLSLSPLQYYQFFTLNSTTLGILNTSRLGW